MQKQPSISHIDVSILPVTSNISALILLQKLLNEGASKSNPARFTDKNLTDELNISYNQLQRAKIILKEKKVLRTMRIGFPIRTYYIVLSDALNALKSNI